MSLEEFVSYKNYFNNNINDILLNYINSEKLIEMILYSLEGGKRLRPIIAMDICNSLSNDKKKSMKFSLAIELIHNASLIIDDLPCMDDDNYRRERLSFHRKYSETMAQIVSAEIVGLAIKLIADSFDKSNLNIILGIVSKNLGILGAATGQLNDVTPLDFSKIKREIIEESKDKNEIKDLIKKKTTSFFEIAFLGGYILGGGNINCLNDIEKISDNFGLAFQIYDDFDDIEQDMKRKDIDLKDQNYINNFGKEEAYNEFLISINSFRKDINIYNLNSKFMTEISDILESKVKKKYNNM